MIGSLIALAANAQSSPPHRLSREALFAARTLRFGARVSVSSDGRYVAYVADNPREATRDADLVTTRSGWQLLPTGAPPGVGQVWVHDLQTGREIAVAGQAGHSWAAAWSPTAPVLAFLSDRGGAP